MPISTRIVPKDEQQAHGHTVCGRCRRLTTNVCEHRSCTRKDTLCARSRNGTSIPTRHPPVTHAPASAHLSFGRTSSRKNCRASCPSYKRMRESDPCTLKSMVNCTSPPPGTLTSHRQSRPSPAGGGAPAVRVPWLATDSSRSPLHE